MTEGQQESKVKPRPLFLEPRHEKEPTDRELLERFGRTRDQAAFALLVRRHGPMVLGVCQRVLNHAQDAEDAFQATFLVLVRKARFLNQPELLANWLYGVAFRIARKARAQALRRRDHELEVACMSPASPLDEAAWSELRVVLDEELHRLPDKYRAPLVLCYLEGKTHLEAAEILGWPSGSMSSRLARGRELLRERLEGRNHALPVGLFAMLLAQDVGAVTVSERLLHGTVRAAQALAEHGVWSSGSIPASVEELATNRPLLSTRLAYALAIVGILLGMGMVALAAMPETVVNTFQRGASGGSCHPVKLNPDATE